MARLIQFIAFVSNAVLLWMVIYKINEHGWPYRNEDFWGVVMILVATISSVAALAMTQTTPTRPLKGISESHSLELAARKAVLRRRIGDDNAA